MRKRRADNGYSELARLVITLAGPGASGKSTVGRGLAERLDMPFVDLDRHFSHQYGDISEYIKGHGYSAYATANVETYGSLLRVLPDPAVIALSSGFMTYQTDVHPGYQRYWQEIADDRSTFVLIPSFDFEACVRETVRRQLNRVFARSRKDEEAVIRDRFHIYVGLPARKIETMRPLPTIIDEIVLSLRAATV